MNWNERKTYVSCLCQLNPTKCNTTKNNTSRRSSSILYFLKIGNNKIQVCKTMFLQTLGLKEWAVGQWVIKSSGGTGIYKGEEPVTKRRNVGRLSGGMKNLTDFFEKLPTLPLIIVDQAQIKNTLKLILNQKCNCIININQNVRKQE